MGDTIRSPAGLLVGAFKNIFAPGAAKECNCKQPVSPYTGNDAERSAA